MVAVGENKWVSEWMVGERESGWVGKWVSECFDDWLAGKRFI